MPRGFQLAAVAFGEEQCLRYPKTHSVSHLLGTLFPYLNKRVEDYVYLTTHHTIALMKAKLAFFRHEI